MYFLVYNLQTFSRKGTLSFRFQETQLVTFKVFIAPGEKIFPLRGLAKNKNKKIDFTSN